MGPNFWTNLIHPSSFPPTRTGHSREWRPQTGGQCLASLEGFSMEAAQSRLPKRSHFGGRRKQKTTCYFSCLSICLFILMYCLYFDCRLCSGCACRGSRERKILWVWMVLECCSISWGQSNPVYPVWGYTVRWWWKQGEGGRPWPQTSETPDLLQFSGTSHGRPPGRVIVPRPCACGLVSHCPLAALTEVWSMTHSHWPRCPELGENSTDTGGTSK